MKARLSEHLRAVRRGETIAVFDRETPVAQIVRWGIDAVAHTKAGAGLAAAQPGAAAEGIGTQDRRVDLLLEKRQGHR